MKSFTDKTGHKWVLDLDVATLRKIKSELGIDLMEANTDQLASIASIKVLVDILWIVLFDQIQALELDETGFAKRLGGKTIGDATDAWMEELIDFFSGMSPARSKALRSMWKTAEELAEVDLKVLDSALGMLCTGLRESPELTQDP